MVSTQKTEPTPTTEKRHAQPVLDKPSTTQNITTVITVSDTPAKKPETNLACKLQGKVIKVSSGDTLTVLDGDKQQHIIRLASIDAPEKGQPFANSAKKYLSDRVDRRQVCVEWYKLDKYQHKIGVVRLNGDDINYSLVKAGLAWHFKKFDSEQNPTDRARYAVAHDQAKSDTIGLWSEPNPIEPGAWRAGTRPKIVSKQEKAKVVQAKRLVQEESSGMSCGGKRYCKEMNSCAEACFYLNQCGVGRLDRDQDGIPCESICGRGCP